MDDYGSEIIKIPSRRTRWGVIISSFLSLFTVGSNVVGFTTYGITSAAKDQEISKAKNNEIKQHRQKYIAWTKYYGTKKGMQERVKKVQREVDKMLRKVRARKRLA